MQQSVVSLFAYRMAKTRKEQHEEYIWRKYRHEITDWCGHDLACQIVADKTGTPERIVRNIVCARNGGF